MPTKRTSAAPAAAPAKAPRAKTRVARPKITTPAEAEGPGQEFSNGLRCLQDEIARLAYHFWEERGCPTGSEAEDWFRAEQEVRRQTRTNGR